VFAHPALGGLGIAGLHRIDQVSVRADDARTPLRHAVDHDPQRRLE